MLWTQALASTLASVAFSGSPAVDGATTFHASFDDQKQPDYALVVGEPFGNAEPVDDGRFGAAMRFGRRTRLNFAIDGQTWSRPEGTIEFWLRPEWSTDESFSIVSVRGPGPDRLDINRDRIGRLGVAVRGGLPDNPTWARLNLRNGVLQPNRWHHVAVVWKHQQLEIWVDSERAAGPIKANPLERSPERLQIGTGEFTIDELRISDIARYPGPVVEAGREPLPNRADRRFPVIEEPRALSFDASAGATAGSRFEIAISHPTQEPSRTRQRPRGPSTLSISSARGESEPAKLVLYAFEDIGGVKVRLQPPVDLPGLTLDVRRVARGPMRRFYRGPVGETENVARHLVHPQNLHVPAGEFREIWLTFGIPPDAQPGIHDGAVEVSVAGAAPTIIPLQVEVHPFSLPDVPNKRMGMYYLPGRRLIEPDRLEAELVDMRAHGITDLIAIDISLNWTRNGDQVEFLSPGIERFFDLATDAGFRHTIVIGDGLAQLDRLFNEDEEPQMIEAARQGAAFIRALDARFPGEIVVTHLDEVFNEDRLGDYIRLAGIARQAGFPRLYATFHTRDERSNRKRLRIAPFVDIRGHHGFTFEWWLARGHTMEEYEAELRAAGSEAWFYHNVRGSYMPPIWGRIINGLYLRASPFVLNSPWIYQDYRGNPYDDDDDPRADLGFAFPEPNGLAGLAPTLIYEEMREGQEDLRTLALLEQLARRDPERHARDLDWLASIDALVREARAGEVATNAGKPSTSPGDGPIDLDTGIRIGIGGVGTRKEAPLIDALSARLDGPALDSIRREASLRITAILESRDTRDASD